MQLAGRIVVTSLAVASISANTTLGLYVIPRTREAIDRRLDNGVEKFAARYARYERWDVAIELYKRDLAKSPNSRATLRKLAGILQQAGDPNAAGQYLGRALRIDLDKLAKNPNSASAYRSLVRTYRMMGDTGTAEKHLQSALRIGLERVKNKPDSANAAYSLGRTYELTDQKEEAVKQLHRAFELEPTRKKFKKAYLKAKLRK